MKIIALFAAGALAATGFAAAPAEAQRRGWNDGYQNGRGFDRGYRPHRGNGFARGYCGFNGPRAFYGGRAFQGRRGYYGGRGYGRGRIVCRIQRGWYGPERVCFRR